MTMPRLMIHARLALALLACAALTACRHAKPAARAVGAGESAQVEGLEVEWWVIDDAHAAENAREPLAEILRESENRVLPFDVAGATRWRANGIRIVAVPLRDLDTIRSRVRLVGPVQDQRFGLLPRWTPVMRGSRWDARHTLSLDSGPVDLSPGSLRLLARCWTVPAEGARARGKAVRLEIVPQHAPDDSGAEPLKQSLGLAPRPAAPDQGVVFSRLATSATCPGGEAYVLVPEPPDVDWTHLDADAPRVRVGAPFANSATLGETLLTDLGGPGLKMVIVLIPRAAGQFEILPR